MDLKPYEGPIWKGEAVSPGLLMLLDQENILVEITTGPPPYQVIVGVPHHAARGIQRIARNWYNPIKNEYGRKADENAGLAGIAVISACREQAVAARLLIASHPSDHDPNKDPASSYWQDILRLAQASAQPALLFELHGAASHRRHDLELSAGRNEKSEPLIFGAALAQRLPGDWTLAVQSRAGASSGQLFLSKSGPCKLQNPALDTAILAETGRAGIPALHLEMKPVFRQPDRAHPTSPRPSLEAWILARALAEVFSSL